MKYDWSKLPKFVKLYKRLNTVIRNKCDDERLINLFMNSLEEFFYSAIKLGYIDASNFDLVIDRLNRIESIGSLFELYSTQTSLSIKDKSNLLFNKEPKKLLFNSNLTDEELKFHIFKELARVASSIEPSVTRGIANEFLFDKDISSLTSSINDRYLEMGFRLIEEGMCLEVAENIYHFSKNIPRPLKTQRTEEDIYGKGIKFLSNFKCSPSYQYLTAGVAGKVIKSEEELSDEKLLYKLYKISLKPDFSENLFLSLKNVYGNNVYGILSSLGVIYKQEINQRRESININPYLRVTDVKKAYKHVVNSLTKKCSKVG